MSNRQDANEGGIALELQSLLSEGMDPNATDEDPPIRVFMLYVSHKSPECTRLLIEAGADLQWDHLEKNIVCFTFCHPYVSEDAYLEGDCILTLDLLMYHEPTFWAAPASVLRSNPPTNAANIAQKSRSLEVWEGASARSLRERDGVLSLLEGRYWQNYGGRNPFLEASTAQEIVTLLIGGAAHNERGLTDMTRLRSISPALRRNVMELLHERMDERKSFLELRAAVTESEDGTLSTLSGHENAIFPIVAVFLGVLRGNPLVNAQGALAMFNELATGRHEREYVAGEW